MSDKFITKGEIRAAVLKRAGFGSQGSAAGPIINVIDEKIEDAYDVLFDLYDVRGRSMDFTFNTAEGQQWYDLPSQLDYDKIENIAVKYSNIFIELTEKITLDHESVSDIRHYPQRYDIEARSISIEKQVNGEFTVDILDANGDAAKGWTWATPSNFSVSGGRLISVFAGTATSSAVLVIGKTYTFSYTIGLGVVSLITLGGTSLDINGNPFPITVGAHTVTMVPVTTAGMTVSVTGAGSTVLDNVSILQNEEPRTQLKLWPEPDGSYLIKIKGTIDNPDLVQDSDIAYVDRTMMKKYVTAHIKKHLNRPDADAAMQELTRRIRQVKAAQHGNKRYIRGKQETRPLPKPVVVDA